MHWAWKRALDPQDLELYVVVSCPEWSAGSGTWGPLRSSKYPYQLSHLSILETWLFDLLDNQIICSIEELLINKPTFSPRISEYLSFCVFMCTYKHNICQSSIYPSYPSLIYPSIHLCIHSYFSFYLYLLADRSFIMIFQSMIDCINKIVLP